RSRILARRKDVPSLQTYSDHSIDKHARLREQRIAGTRSLPARWVRQLLGSCRTVRLGPSRIQPKYAATPLPQSLTWCTKTELTETICFSLRM
ncbi:MAG TPA: hypothetical protein VN939_14095, partial [Chthoniobacterales bacterium]|nr:hypothetical protein [Chthoniobacterales bacterium]